ncbi:MAG: MBL fold metallo-hydrolase [Ruminococcaceae bacterium]|nr:MBL fold metallo-hydrolase [Oscillospiraceae bacterium]
MFKRIPVMILTSVLLLCSFAGCYTPESETPAVSGTSGEETEVKKEGTVLTFIDHASIKIQAKDGRIILIDPNAYSSTAYDDEADFILVTHGHEDHKPLSDVKLKEDGIQITWNEALVDGEYQRFEYDGIIIEAVVAGGNDAHPIGSGVGYLVTVDGICVYHAGDSSNDEALHVLKDYDIDYAFYPIDGQFNMDAVEATELANIIGATHNIPFHMLNKVGQDKSENFTPEGRLVLKEGESIVLEK